MATAQTQEIVLRAQRRTEFGTHRMRRLRAAGLVPGIIYGHGEAPEPISLPLHELQLALEHEHHLLRVNLDGRTDQYLLKEVQYDHLGEMPVHVDLMRVTLDEVVEVEVALEMRGEPRGTKEGGLFEQLLTSVEVECPVARIPEVIVHNVSDLGIGDVVHVRDLVLPEGVRATSPPDAVVCLVKAPVTAEAAEAEEAVTEAGAEPELIREREEEGEES